ncbi:O-methyltransferase [Aspergillus neoniger CBS 115656]|uniref:O-methyltransferase n=1 Tax=Aspergillus neoniger (strain CBS 115656) TaxID=1448310 RepID=A0A318Y5S5_ASPNB|nr:O-methyltransferase [Aspergillus neoniger CBS 115656]PYH29219.1 O-methyltransferase [Aspergillus neoniger CBS 115656]
MSLTDLAARITANAQLLDAHLQSHNLPYPSTATTGSPDFPNPNNDPAVESARIAILEDTQTLRNYALGPAQVVRELCWSTIDLAVQQVLYHFSIPTLIPLKSSISYATLSSQTNLPERTLRLLLRQSFLNDIFHEPEPDHVAHTAPSAALVMNAPFYDWFGHSVEEVFPASAKLSEALTRCSRSGIEEGRAEDSAFSLAIGGGESVFEFFEKRPDKQRRFRGAMEAVGMDGGHDLGFVVGGFDWGKLGRGVVVDVGGSSGFLSIALANAYEDLSLVVQYYKHTVDEGRVALPPHLSERVSFQAHDFFAPQTVPGDVFLLRHVCHNWSDENAARILRNLVPAMKNSSRILLVEVVTVRPGVVDRVQERYMRNVDVTMLQMLNTQERSREDWEGVIALADKRLKVLGIHRPEGSWDSIIEIGFVVMNGHA